LGHRGNGDKQRSENDGPTPCIFYLNGRHSREFNPGHPLSSSIWINPGSRIAFCGGILSLNYHARYLMNQRPPLWMVSQVGFVASIVVARSLIYTLSLYVPVDDTCAVLLPGGLAPRPTTTAGVMDTPKRILSGLSMLPTSFLLSCSSL